MRNARRVMARICKSALIMLLGFAASVWTWLALFGFGSASLTSAGIYVLYGAGPALIVLGAYFLLFAGIVFKGITHG